MILQIGFFWRRVSEHSRELLCSCSPSSTFWSMIDRVSSTPWVRSLALSAHSFARWEPESSVTGTITITIWQRPISAFSQRWFLFLAAAWFTFAITISGFPWQDYSLSTCCPQDGANQQSASYRQFATPLSEVLQFPYSFSWSRFLE